MLTDYPPTITECQLKPGHWLSYLLDGEFHSAAILYGSRTIYKQIGWHAGWGVWIMQAQAYHSWHGWRMMPTTKMHDLSEIHSLTGYLPNATPNFVRPMPLNV